VPIHIAVVIWPEYLLPVFSTTLIAMHLATTLDRHWLLVRGLRHRSAIIINDDDALAVPDSELPLYTVLLPVYQEPTIVSDLINGVGNLAYPKDKLEILLLLEEDDIATQRAVIDLDMESVRTVVVPHSLPKTKPKACNYGMSLPDLRGEFVTIYDAEDIPDPLQLRRAVVAFSRVDPDVGCFQARLGYYNENQNLLTRWFSLEYAQWFGLVLPAVEAAKCVVPLGGTSNHMRTSVWQEIGGWDEFNVTEDADLGVRLARHGFRTQILESTTLEEANSDVINWIRQRSRWYKGYIQTMAVHLRNPRALVDEIGLKQTLRLIGLTGAVPFASAFNLVLSLILIIWIGSHANFVALLFPPVTYYICLAMFLVGAPASIYLGLISAHALGKPHLWWAVLLSPLYWLLQSVAALKALYQFVFRPFYWEKTVHGLSTGQAELRTG
jgi:cellulose synthase/poly-beta-1,6-N-acetylglucosamine synthase-like glycosyltransferase